MPATPPEPTLPPLEPPRTSKAAAVLALVLKDGEGEGGGEDPPWEGPVGMADLVPDTTPPDPPEPPEPPDPPEPPEPPVGALVPEGLVLDPGPVPDPDS
jgi:hypothetical protein